MLLQLKQRADMKRLKYTSFETDPLTADLTLPRRRVATWSVASVSGLLGADFLTDRGQGLRLGSAAYARSVRAEVVFFDEDLRADYVIVEMVGATDAVREIVKSARRSDFELYRPYDRNSVAAGSRALHVPQRQSSLAADRIRLDPQNRLPGETGRLGNR